MDATRALALGGPTARKAITSILGILAVVVPLAVRRYRRITQRAPASARVESLVVTGSNTGALPVAAASLPTVVDALGYQPRSLVGCWTPVRLTPDWSTVRPSQAELLEAREVSSSDQAWRIWSSRRCKMGDLVDPVEASPEV
jgi:hypothetical protein